MTGHTPAPWRIDRHDGPCKACRVNHTYSPSLWIEGRRPVAQLSILPLEGYGFIPENNAEQEANARLIAAAPELLVACKAALPHLADLVARTCGEAKEFGVGFADRIAFDKLEAAIEKAEGKTVRA